MDTTFRRKMSRTRVNHIDVESDGRTVWINESSRCVARFCPDSREFLIDEKDPQMVKHADSGPTREDWTDFYAVIEGAYHIDFPQEHRPMYIRDVAA